MSISVQSINGDACFLITFSPLPQADTRLKSPPSLAPPFLSAHGPPLSPPLSPPFSPPLSPPFSPPLSPPSSPDISTTTTTTSTAPSSERAPSAPAPPPPGSITILTDPWLSHPAQIFSRHFSHITPVPRPTVPSLAALPHDPDLVLISQAKPDHCNRRTLASLPADSAARLLAVPQAARKIRRWRDVRVPPERLTPLRTFDPKRPRETVLRVPVPVPSEWGGQAGGGTEGELTVALVEPARVDLTGLHNAVGVTYRPPAPPPPGAAYPPSPHTAVSPLADLPPTPPDSPTPITTTTTTNRLLTVPFPPPPQPAPPTVSLLYTPHGLPLHPTLTSYAAAHLSPLRALPLTLLLHPLDTVRNPALLGGTIANGARGGGAEVARGMGPARCWVGAHDGEKKVRGWSVKWGRTVAVGEGEARGLVDGGASQGEGKDAGEARRRDRCEVFRLRPGEGVAVSTTTTTTPSSSSAAVPAAAGAVTEVRARRDVLAPPAPRGRERVKVGAPAG